MKLTGLQNIRVLLLQNFGFYEHLIFFILVESIRGFINEKNHLSPLFLNKSGTTVVIALQKHGMPWMTNPFFPN